MDLYDPRTTPPAGEWLALDESARIELVSAYHQRNRIQLPNPELHATIHVVIENQLALGDTVVANTLARLEGEGLDRHDAIHAMGSVLAERLYELLREDCDLKDEGAYAQYLKGLNDLTAQKWLSSR